MPKKTRAIKLTDRRSGKPWLKKLGVTKYEVEKRDKSRTFLIVNEGQTEELYFKSFPVVTATVKCIPLGCSKTQLVECTKEMCQNELYDEVWCVFDLDLKPDIANQKEDFNRAIKMAKDEGFNCAYSNDAFELWFVLHYQFIDQQQLRSFFYEKLSSYWNLNYEKKGKNRKFAQAIYSLLENDAKANQQRAISNSKKLYEQHKDKAYHLQNPVTTVFELVECLNKHLRS